MFVRVLYGRKNWVVIFVPYGDWFYWNEFRLNNGTPYTAWKVGPIMVKRYLR